MEVNYSRTINMVLLLWITLLDTLALSVFFGTSIPLILAPNSILLVGVAHHDLIYGFTLAILPIGQFLLGPIWGQLADEQGRKIILRMTLLGSFLGFSLMALAIDEKAFWVFILGRTVSALVAINGVLGQASMADMSHDIQKTKRFNLQFIMISMGFIVSPYLLQSTTHYLHFSYVYWLLAASYLLTVLLMLLVFSETLFSLSKQKIKWMINFDRILIIFKEKPLRKILIVWLVFQIGWNLFFQYSGEFLYSGRHLPNAAINQLYSWVCLGILVSQIFLVHPMIKKILPARVIPGSIMAVGVSLLFAGLIPIGLGFYLVLSLYCVGMSFFLTNFNAYISNLAPPSQQGRIMAMLMAGTAAMTIIVTLIGNFLVTQYLAAPYVIGGAIVLLSALFWFFRKN